MLFKFRNKLFLVLKKIKPSDGYYLRRYHSYVIISADREYILDLLEKDKNFGITEINPVEDFEFRGFFKINKEFHEALREKFK